MNARYFHGVVVLLASALCAAPLAASQNPTTREADATPVFPVHAFRAAARAVAPSVVTIETVGGTQPAAELAGAAFMVADGPTTGLVWSSDGLILTSSFNFVRDPSVITVVLADGRRFVAELLGRDEIRRLAMLAIDATDLPVPKWAASTDMKVGQWAISLGRGHGRQADVVVADAGGCTITAGIISGLRRMSGLVIQTDARLSPANFGAPLIDIAGRVLGLCVPMGMDGGQLSGVQWYDSGIGFAVPREQVEIAAQQLAKGRDIRPGLLGVGLASPVPGAVFVAGCGDPSPALRAGIQPGDRIVAVNDQPVTGVAQLKRLIRPLGAGTRIVVHVERQGRKLELPLMLATREDIGPISQPSPESEPESMPESVPENEPREQTPVEPMLPPDEDRTPVVPPATGPA
ncbi:MAG TPA: trypsin-like peptidase domain-containing protein [Phycisphaerae bacterium]|nr:trypsin-like peptidase domain-containing protein [Phycisphaerae bacterium]HOJ72531.1 trypsin-like peptidase domain-containing protein [Phycisphaerae bacterium]HOM49808.1 trypsin-like peptidase domain-containing protein [Phycisphaerae bacterium]HOQ84254.1 trypsin-like peptidase domain-containing protein [Phycisphaerae bacterium]HPP25177.1 trypsin-like peptidase domain-containing protein [Phycisphaerae bacterium]